MPKPLVISSEEDEEAANAFCEFSSGQKLDAKQVFKKGGLDKHIGSDSGPIFYMGHTDDTQKKIGDMTPKELAKKFADGVSPGNRKQVKDLYLISCEAGLLPDPSLAKQLSIELKKQGFTNLKIHAVSSSPVRDAPGMYVQVITNQGIFSNAALGSIQAYAYTTDQAGKRRKEIDDKLRQQDDLPLAQLTALRKEINAMAKAGAPGIKPLMQDQRTFSQLMTEFDKPQNTYGVASKATVEATPARLVDMLDRFINFVTHSSDKAPQSDPTSRFKMQINKDKFIAAYDTMVLKLGKLEKDYGKNSKAHSAAKELIDALEPMHSAAKSSTNVIAPVELNRQEFQRLDAAVIAAKKELPVHRGFIDQFFSVIAKFFKIEYKTDSEKKLSAITDEIDKPMSDVRPPM